MSAKFDKSTVEYSVKLARMKLSDKEMVHLSSQLADVLKYIEKLNKVDTSKVEPTSHVLAIKNVFREDRVKKSLDASNALKNAPAKEGAFFKVPKIIE